MVKSTPQNESRWAPASLLPAITIGLRMSSSVAAVRFLSGGPCRTNCVASPSASEMSRKQSRGSSAISRATSVTLRPTHHS